VGHNGAGKSTLLKLVARITAPTAGRIDTRGRVASLIELGVGFHPDLTGAENVRFTAAILGMDARTLSNRFDEIVDFAGIGAFIDTPVKRYSSGMLTRLGFSVAAHLDADILLIDEVLGVGDVEFQRRSYERLRQLRSAGAAILFVSHNLFALSQVSERGICLQNGRVIDAGSIDQVISRYQRSFDMRQSSAPHSDPHARFERVRMPRSARPNGSLEIAGTVAVKRPLTKSRVHITISTLEGATVLTTADEESARLLWRPGEWDFKALIGPVSLAPRTYRLWLSIFEEEGDMTYAHDQVWTELQVADERSSPWDGFGVMVAPVRWDHRSIGTNPPAHAPSAGSASADDDVMVREAR
jgi:lipopolysaccharide transport system ATP-binding protein